jgi:hypothetical protein
LHLEDSSRDGELVRYRPEVEGVLAFDTSVDRSKPAIYGQVKTGISAGGRDQ